jgi:2-polyprenyl-6-methoxyphenol hydroxylase-like FAD-dependent oxidoreductase
MRILIIGAGISGLCTAIAFKKMGINVRIVEKAPALRSEGIGIALPLNAVNGLIYLGLKDKLLAKAHEVKNIIYLAADGTLLSEASLLQKPFGDAPFLSILRKNLISILAEAVGDGIQFGVSAKITESINGNNVAFSNGENAQFDLVVAADGVHSKTRKALTQKESTEDLGISTCRFLAKANIKNPTYYFGKKSAFMFYPLNEEEAYCYFHHSDTAHVITKYSSKTELANLFNEFSDEVKNAILAIEEKDLIFGRLISVSEPILRKGNVAFVGDAAHACSPMLQQGTAKAIEDAITLAAMLKNSQDISSALKHYVNFRIKQIQWITINSDMPIKKLASTITDEQYELMKQQIKKEGPINVTKWKELFSVNFILSLNQYVSRLKDSHGFF